MSPRNKFAAAEAERSPLAFRARADDQRKLAILRPLRRGQASHSGSSSWLVNLGGALRFPRHMIRVSGNDNAPRGQGSAV